MLHRPLLLVLNRLLPLILLLSAATPARAAVIALTAGDFAGVTPITFAGVADGTPVNGLTVGGVLFNYLVSNVPSPAGAIIDGGPGVTNNVAPPNVVNVSNVNAVLRMTFSVPEVRLGYGYAVLSFGAIANATTVSLYDASNVLVGTLSANGVPDPIFAGGFLGLQSTLPFVRADLTFSTLGAAFALDNIRVVPAAAVPEPVSLMLLGMGLVGVSARRLTQRHS